MLQCTTSLHAGIISKDICDGFLTDIYKAFCESSEISSENYSPHALEKLVLNLYGEGALGKAIKSFNRSVEMSNFVSLLKSILRNKLGVSLEEFPVHSLRIMSSEFQVNQLDWHQDEATWYFNKQLSGLYPFTFWMPLLPSQYSAIEAKIRPSSKIFYHRKIHKQGRFSAVVSKSDEQALEGAIFNDIDLGSCISFAGSTLHRSWSDKSRQFFRVSVDVRFIIEDLSQELASSTSVSAKMRLLKFLNSHAKQD